MKRKLTGIALFLAGFAVAMVMLSFQERIQPALAGQCWMDAPQSRGHDQTPDSPDNRGRFAVVYKVPPCILDQGYTVFNTKFQQPNEFIVVYKK